MYKHTVLYLILLLFALGQQANAQVGKFVVKKKGYVVTIKNDTIKGYLRIETDYENQYKIAVYDAADGGKKKQFTPHTAKSFSYYQLLEKKWVNYDSHQLTKLKLSRLFMKRIKAGEVILYSVLHNGDAIKGYNYFESYCLAKPETDEFLVVNQLNFKRPMKAFFNKDSKLVAQMGKKGYRYKNIPQIVDQYNDAGSIQFSKSN